jgi:hypothetical protein
LSFVNRLETLAEEREQRRVDHVGGSHLAGQDDDDPD